MRKILCTAATLALALTMLAGCRGNVSNREDGMITDPTNTSATVGTMPETDTAPIATTDPVTTDATETTGSTTDGTGNATDNTENPARNSRPGRPRGMH